MDSVGKGEGGKIWENGIETWMEGKHINLDSITTFRASAVGPPWAKAVDLHVAISKSLATKTT